MKAEVTILLKAGVLDPQGKAIGHALNGLGFGSVGEVRQGKVIDLELSETDAAKAQALANRKAEKEAAEAKLAADQEAERLAGVEAEAARIRQEAEAKAARDARYAARKARK